MSKYITIYLMFLLHCYVSVNCYVSTKAILLTVLGIYSIRTQIAIFYSAPGVHLVNTFAVYTIIPQHLDHVHKRKRNKIRSYLLHKEL